MKYCIQCGSGLTVSGTCVSCASSRATPSAPKNLWPLLPLLFSLAIWGYHEYELNRSADAIRTSFDTIKATVDKSGAH